MALHELTERERKVLEAVIQMYVETAEPTGSRALSRRSGLGVSPATIRNTMSDLEEKGFLFHPHTSAGRVPTDKAYRVYVDALMAPAQAVDADYQRLAEEISAGSATVEAILRRAAQSLGLVTQELGLALGPQVDRTMLQRVDLVRLASDRVLVVLTLKGGAARTIFIEARGEISDRVVAEVALLLNERLAGLTLAQIRSSLAERLRDGADRSHGAAELLNIFVEEREHLFDASLGGDGAVVLGQASLLAEQPEFASGEHLRRLLELTESGTSLGELLRRRSEVAGPVSPGITITIGNEHPDPRLDRFTLVTGEYRAGPCTGLIGVIGPTRMPYEKVVAMVSHASRLLTELLD